MAKDVSKLSVEELMEIAKLPVKPLPKKMSPAKQFIIADGLEQGTDHIPASVIYARYTNWAKAANLEPITSGKFFKEFRLYFKKIIRQNISHYILSVKGFNMALEEIYISKTTSEKRTSRGKSKKEPVQT